MGELDDAERIAHVHIRSWQQAYAGQLPADYLDRLPESLDARIANWRTWMAAARPWLAELGDELVGFAAFGRSLDDDAKPDTSQVWAIYLLAEHWGRGVGKRLMSAALASLHEAGYRRATLWVLESNRRARRFYEAGGWNPDGATKQEALDDVVFAEVRYARELPAG